MKFLLSFLIKGYAQLHRGEWTFTERRMHGDTHEAILIILKRIKK
jgi:hypothetical protein